MHYRFPYILHIRRKFNNIRAKLQTRKAKAGYIMPASSQFICRRHAAQADSQAYNEALATHAAPSPASL